MQCEKSETCYNYSSCIKQEACLGYVDVDKIQAEHNEKMLEIIDELQKSPLQQQCIQCGKVIEDEPEVILCCDQCESDYINDDEEY